MMKKDMYEILNEQFEEMMGEMLSKSISAEMNEKLLEVMKKKKNGIMNDVITEVMDEIVESKKTYYFYIRVSTQKQNLDRQLVAVEKYIADKKIKKNEYKIVEEKKSGKNYEDREEYMQLRKKLRKGDELIVKSLDRLGRNYSEMRDEMIYFDKRNIKVRVLSLPSTLMDDDNPMVKVVNEILIALLGMMAEQEREMMLERQAEAIAILPKKNGRLYGSKKDNYYGRPRLEFPANFKEVYNKYKKSKITSKEAAALTNFNQRTFFRKIKQYEEQMKYERKEKIKNKNK